MKTEEFDRKNGEKGYRYKPEAGDEFVCTHNQPKELEARAVNTKDGRAVLIKDYIIGVRAGNDDIVLSITSGMYKVLSKTNKLMDKKIKFETYTAKWTDDNGVEQKRPNTLGVRVIE